MTVPELATASAPGRLDFMGGVADYSGSLVLETPIEAETEVTVTLLEQEEFHFASEGTETFASCSFPLIPEIISGANYEFVVTALNRSGIPTWARYILGCVAVLTREKNIEITSGLDFHVQSGVPVSSGVSSSAALEIATLQALAQVYAVEFSGTELATLGQLAENRVVGAPCGIMDQLSAAFGKHGFLLPILCRPDRLLEPVKLPDGITVIGWPSGVKHDVGASPYGITRTAAFMGKKVLEEKTGSTWQYATEIEADYFAKNAKPILPESMSGRDFLEKYKSVDDPLSVIDPSVSYPVRAALEFPVMENARCHQTLELLQRVENSNLEETLRDIGTMLLGSHEGYGAMGLGNPQTDLMVEALMEYGPNEGIYGARISGGGSGGTVVVLLQQQALPLLEKVRKKVETTANAIPFIT